MKYIKICTQEKNPKIFFFRLEDLKSLKFIPETNEILLAFFWTESRHIIEGKILPETLKEFELFLCNENGYLFNLQIQV